MGFFLTLLYYVVVFALSELLRPKPDIENAKPAGLGDFQFPTASEGRPVPIIWGTVRQKGPNVTWYGDFLQEPIREKIKTGLFSSEEVIRGYRYHLGVQMALCRGGEFPVQLLSQWIGDVPIPIGGPHSAEDTFLIDCRELFGGDELGQGGVFGEMQFFGGAELQSVSPYLSQYQTIGGGTPRYSGTCYVVPATERTYLGNSTSIKPWAFELRRLPNGLGLSSSLAGINGGFDANPANVIYEILTDQEWGLGFDPTTIDLSNFQAAATTLANEGNGFSFILDREIDTNRLLRQVEEQIDAVVYQDVKSGFWRIQMIRDDYVIDNQPEITQGNMKTLHSFSRSSWEDTTNVVKVAFNDRADTYKETTAVAQDSANIRTLQGTVVSTTQNYPGVKDGDLAAFLAWRQLRTMSYPLVKISVTVNRGFYDVIPGAVVAFSNASLGISKLPMRIQRIRQGTLTDGSIRLELIQDVFTAQAASFAAPPGTGWEIPEDVLVAYANDRQLAFEAPRGLVRRDPQSGGVSTRIYATARQAGTEVGFRLVQRPNSGLFVETAEIFGPLARIGQLQGSVPRGVAAPAPNITLVGSPDSAVIMESLFTDTTDPSDLGIDLVNLCVIDPGGPNEEFILVSSAQVTGNTVVMQQPYRGALDSVQKPHLAGEEVWLLFAGGGISTDSFAEAATYQVKLLPFSATDEVEEGDATQIQIITDRRVRRPLPPSALTLNGVLFPASTLMDSAGLAGTGEEEIGIRTIMRRRDYRTLNEIDSMLEDAAILDPTYPSVNSTVHDIAVRVDPDGVNTLLFTEEDVAVEELDILRLKILRFNGGAVPLRLRFEITATHTDGGLELDSREPMTYDFNVTSALLGDFEFGALLANAGSASYTAVIAGSYGLTLSSAFTAGEVQYRVNGGSWTTGIAAAATTGTIAGVNASDTLEFRHTSPDVDALKQLSVDAPGVGQDGFAVLYN